MFSCFIRGQFWQVINSCTMIHFAYLSLKSIRTKVFVSGRISKTDLAAQAGAFFERKSRLEANRAFGFKNNALFVNSDILDSN